MVATASGSERGQFGATLPLLGAPYPGLFSDAGQGKTKYRVTDVNEGPASPSCVW